jgi:hypothetical protein
VNVNEFKVFGRKRSWHNFKMLSRNSPGGTEEITENAQSGSPRIEPGTSRIRSRNAKHSTTTFCPVIVKCVV